MRSLLPVSASMAVGVVPVFILLRYFGVPRKPVTGVCVNAYVVGVLFLKMPLHHFLVVKRLHHRLSHAVLGVVQGLVSAFSGTGSTFCLFLFVLPDLPSSTLWDSVSKP